MKAKKQFKNDGEDKEESFALLKNQKAIRAFNIKPIKYFKDEKEDEETRLLKSDYLAKQKRVIREGELNRKNTV